MICDLKGFVILVMAYVKIILTLYRRLCNMDQISVPGRAAVAKLQIINENERQAIDTVTLVPHF